MKSRLPQLVILILTGLFLTACSFPGVGPQKADLTYWGLFEGEDVFKPLINDYIDKHPKTTIEYSQKSYATLSQYKETVLTRLKEGKAADVIRIHVSWLKSFAPYLYSLPTKVMSKEEFGNTFYPAAVKALTINGEIYGLPLHYDGLLLLANKKLLTADQVAPPKLWTDFRDAAAKLTKTDPQTKKITQAGAAIGVAGNIPHAADILSLMFLQSRLRIPENLDSQNAADSLTFYVDKFFKEDKVWDESLAPSILAFSRGQVAFIFAPSWRILEIKANNPGLEIVVLEPPQIVDAQEKVVAANLASFWVEVVPKASKFKNEAFDFLKFLVSSDSQKKLYALESSRRLFGEAPSRKDLASQYADDPYLAPLLKTALTAEVAPSVDGSGNDALVDIFNRAISDVVGGSDPKTALLNAKKNLTSVLGGEPAPAATKK